MCQIITPFSKKKDDLEKKAYRYDLRNKSCKVNVLVRRLEGGYYMPRLRGK